MDDFLGKAEAAVPQEPHGCQWQGDYSSSNEVATLSVVVDSETRDTYQTRRDEAGKPTDIRGLGEAAHNDAVVGRVVVLKRDGLGVTVTYANSAPGDDREGTARKIAALVVGRLLLDH